MQNCQHNISFIVSIIYLLFLRIFKIWCCRYDEDQRFGRDPEDDRSIDNGRGGGGGAAAIGGVGGGADGNGGGPGDGEGLEPFENGVPGFVRGDNGQMFQIKQEHEIKHEMLDY